MKSNLSVSQLNNYINGVIDDELILKDIKVFGEVSDVSYSGGNIYFTVYDSLCRISCVYFRSYEKLNNSDEVLLTASVSFYKKSGKISLVVSEINPYGKGKALANLEKLKEKLRLEGLFENRLTPPSFINRVAVVTSGTGAVIHDILNVLARRHDYINVSIFSSKVQGALAESEIIKSFNEIDKLKVKPDVIVLARGGGSSDDLSVFNSEDIARRIAVSKIAVISAIGHETDYSLCDFTAGIRAGTPSIAAEIISNTNDKLLARFYAASDNIKKACTEKYADSYSRLKNLVQDFQYKSRLVYFSGHNRLKDLSSRTNTAIDSKIRRFESTIKNNITKIFLTVNESEKTRRYKLNIIAAKLDMLSPLKLMAGGYIKAFNNKKPIIKTSDVLDGDNIILNVSDGSIEATVVDIKRKK